MGYQDWLKVGMALHSTGAGKEAFDLWDTWSQRGASYGEGECAYRWSTFTRGAGITIGSLLHMARSAGWRPLREDVDRLVERCVEAHSDGLEWEQVLNDADPKRQTVDQVLGQLAQREGFSGKRVLSQDYNSYVADQGRRPDVANNQAVHPSEFLAYLPEHRYIYRPTGDLWPAESVRAHCRTPTPPQILTTHHRFTR